jgi:predicted permease
MGAGSRGALANRVYATLLHVYPRNFRARFQHDMRQTFARDYERASAEGGRFVFWTRTVCEAAAYGMRERLTRMAGLFTGSSGPAGHGIDTTGGSMVSRLLVDWRDAWRGLRATPIVTSAAVLSLALGIGANTALFSILNSLVLTPLPVRDAQQLVLLEDGSWTNPIWEQIRDRQASIAGGAFAWSSEKFDLAARGERDLVDGAYASGSMFGVLGLTPARGRFFAQDDDRRGGGAGGGVAVVSYGFWQRRLGGAQDVIGRQITLDRATFAVIGVMPRGFSGVDVGQACDVVIPLGNEPLIRGTGSYLDGRSTWWLEIMFRLKPGQTMDQASAALNVVRPQIRAATLPEDWPAQMQATYMDSPLALVSAASGRSPLRTRFQQPLAAMMVVVGLVLFIACANIANLLLARATARRRDLSVRLALGASRSRVVKQLMWESLLLAGAGGLLGLGVARIGSALLVQQLGPTVFLDTAIDLRILAFTAGIGVLTAVIFGVAPAFLAAQVSPYEALKTQARTIAGDRRWGARNALVVAQVALSLTLVVAAGLFIRTFQSLTTVPLGMNVDRLLNVAVDVKRSAASSPEERIALFERLRDRAAATPGISRAAISMIQPLSGGGWNSPVDLPDSAPARPRQRLPWFNGVSPEWFRTYGLKILAGRDFSPDDRIGRPNAVVVNQAFARRFLNGQQPVGLRFSKGEPGGKKTEYEIVGLVSDSVYRSVRDGAPATVYVPLRQVENVWPDIALTIELTSDAWADVERRLGQELSGVDASVAFTMSPFADRVRSTLVQERLVAVLSGSFGALALLLAAVGLYGVTAYGVSRRRTEIGVRMALGAEPSRVVRLVLGRVAWLVGAGVLLGAGVSLWAAKFIAPALLFGLEPRDPLTFAIAISVLIIVGLVTAWLPARRASRIDPTEVLREG